MIHPLIVCSYLVRETVRKTLLNPLYIVFFFVTFKFNLNKENYLDDVYKLKIISHRLVTAYKSLETKKCIFYRELMVLTFFFLLFGFQKVFRTRDHKVRCKSKT